MNKNDLTSRLVRRLQEVHDREEVMLDERCAVEAAKEILEEGGTDISPEMIQEALGQVKKERYEVVNYHSKTIKTLVSGSLEGLFAFPTYLNKVDDQPLAYTIPGIFGTAINLVIPFRTLWGIEQILESQNYEMLIPASVLVLTNVISAYREAFKSTKRREEKINKQKYTS